MTNTPRPSASPAAQMTHHTDPNVAECMAIADRITEVLLHGHPDTATTLHALTLLDSAPPHHRPAIALDVHLRFDSHHTRTRWAQALGLYAGGYLGPTASTS